MSLQNSTYQPAGFAFHILQFHSNPIKTKAFTIFKVWFKPHFPKVISRLHLINLQLMTVIWHVNPVLTSS